jgi:hypothetical protein
MPSNVCACSCLGFKLFPTPVFCLWSLPLLPRAGDTFEYRFLDPFFIHLSTHSFIQHMFIENQALFCHVSKSQVRSFQMLLSRERGWIGIDSGG